MYVNSVRLIVHVPASVLRSHCLLVLLAALPSLKLGYSLPQHIWNNEESDVGSSDIDLVQVGDTSVAGGDSDVLKLHVHVVLSLEELAAVDLAGGDLESNDVALVEGQYAFEVW